MTIRWELETMLVEHGLSFAAARAVLDAVHADPTLASVLWGDHTEGYQPQFLAVLWVATKREALIWIDANLPLAEYRLLFVDEPAVERAG